jgi:hypothetical protein
MKRRFGPLVAIGGAGVIVASALVAAQEPKVEPAPEAAKGRVVLKELAPVRIEGQVGGGVVLPVLPGAPPAPVIHLDIAPGVPGLGGGIETSIEQYRPYLRVEYHFLRMVCALSEEQRRPIAREAERAFVKAMQQYDELRQPGQLRRAGEPARVLPDPRKLIQQGLARVAAEHLSAEQAARYRAELEQRAEDRKRVMIRSLVEKLDDELILSPAQRTRLTETLNSHWNESWFPTEPMMMNPERYLSRIPIQHLDSVLNADLRNLWNQILRKPVGVEGLLVGRSVPDDFPEDEELAEAREAERKHAEVSP